VGFYNHRLLKFTGDFSHQGNLGQRDANLVFHNNVAPANCSVTFRLGYFPVDPTGILGSPSFGEHRFALLPAFQTKAGICLDHDVIDLELPAVSGEAEAKRQSLGDCSTG
jgi:hypothetical protein